MMDVMELEDVNTSSRMVKFLYYLWKLFTCLFLHLFLIAIVAGYCYFGMIMFKNLEQHHEEETKKWIISMRENVSNGIWQYTYSQKILHKDNWTADVNKHLQYFHKEVVHAMRKKGWNGNDSTESKQWTDSSALFYSIIVITTIGYGHIAPKTPQGKIATIFYAVVGIPLMLLCLSNIGDVMAHSFRFIYWRICCYKCTQPPKRIPLPPRRVRSFRGTIRSHGNRFSGRSRTTSFRQSGRNSQKSADSAIGLSETYTRSSYSDTECRYYDETELENGVPDKSFNRQSQQSRYSDNVTMYQSPRHSSQPPSYRSQSSSYRGRAVADTAMAEYGDYMSRNSPVVYNKYALEREESCRSKTQNVSRPREGKFHQSRRRDPRTAVKDDSALYRQSGRREQAMAAKDDSVLGSRRSLAPGMIASPPNDYPVRYRRDRPHSTSSVGRHKENMGPSPRIMSPLGFAVHRQTFPRARDAYVDDYYDYYYDFYDYYQHDYTRPVPIWLCVFLVISYIIGGAILFEKQENWGFFNSAYFCFITLTTIGFGDYVPQMDNHNSPISAAVTPLYLLFGIALLAMSFNLVQEEVINNVKSVARHLGIIKDEDSDD